MKAKNGAFSSFELIHKAYRIANLLKKSTGVFGYGGETAFNDIAVYPPNSIPTQLNPGGAIYINPSTSDLTNFSPSGQGTNIKFVKMPK